MYMNETSARFAFPFILPGQAQKELFHNEAIAAIDAALHPAVEGAPLATPPTSPLPGRCWLVGPGASGAWLEKEGQLAAWTSGGWRFVAPQAGMCVWDKAAGVHRRWTGIGWTDGDVAATALKIEGLKVIGARQPAVSTASGGTIIDAEARSAISNLIVTLRTHGLIE
jgi:hypothetical protein